jgi:POT family proton-dependent oligopeptide transporter
MSSATQASEELPKTEYVKKTDDSIIGHPKGLMTLFFTEMWERFSYYGMRAILLLYMVTAVEKGGLGFATVQAATIYGLYTSSVYLMSIPGGWVADNILGARMAVLFGGIVIALGHFSMALADINFFYAGLILIVLGTGLLKPNISTMVGALYPEGDPRRDGGFSIFYMGINLGAFVAPLVCGFLAQDTRFQNFLRANNFNPLNAWHWGFGAAGVGMTLGLIIYLSFQKNLIKVSKKPDASTPELLKRTAMILAGVSVIGVLLVNNLWMIIAGGIIAGAGWFLFSLKGEERNRFIVILILFVFAAFFWAAFEQAGSSLTLFADKLTRNNILGWEFPSSWFQSVNSVFIIILAPLFSLLWVALGSKQPSSPAKFSLGLLFAGLGFVVVAFASTLTGGGPVSPMWLVSVYFIHTVGELCLSPVGLSTITKLAPPRLVGQMMGVWFLAAAVGNYIAGTLAGHFDEKAEGAVFNLFSSVAIATIASALVLAAITPYARKLIGKAA